MKIYTKSGDEGKSGLIGGKRVSKNDPRLVTYGCIDELNAHLGHLIALTSISIKIEKTLQTTIHINLSKIQNELFNIGSLLACDNHEWIKKLPPLSDKSVSDLELQIDTWEASLTPLKNFILPQGDICATQAHICRTVCRRAERELVSLLDHIQSQFTTECEGFSSDEKIIDQSIENKYQHILKYLNRLSDYFFVLSRWLNFKTNNSETLWTSS